ncbi:hypothetical protein DL771_005405 [Monosporascus sp. 5C6A]|nr:hypothetical protein DL771_005405 [Monosporascus sp. 5C6A]
MPSPKHLLVSTAALFTAVHAVTPIPDSTMTTWLSSGGVDLAKPQHRSDTPSDWERVIVIWTKSSTTWTPSHLLLSQHSGYDRKSWSSVQNTFNTADISLPRGGDNGRKNLDHPKVYVAWSKHANYNDRNTGWNDVLSQLTNNAFRS